MSGTPLNITFEVVAKIPNPRGFYWKILDAFLEQEYPIVMVKTNDVLPTKLRNGLGQTLREKPQYKGQARVCLRGGNVYLEKLNIDKEVKDAYLELCNSTSSPFWPTYEEFQKEFQSLKGKVNNDG